LPDERRRWAWENMRWGGHLRWQGECARGAALIRERLQDVEEAGWPVRSIDPAGEWSATCQPVREESLARRKASPPPADA
jgi:hypothetical protein